MAIRKQDLMEQKDAPKAKAARLKRLRKLTNLERTDVEKHYGINVSTLKGWETARAHGLSKKGALAFLEIAEKEGVICSFDWLMFGIGAGPRIVEKFDALQPITPLNHDDEESNIVRELQLFHQHYPAALDFIVNDDGMEPFFSMSDYIAGISCPDKKIPSIIGNACILQTQDGKLLLRKLTLGRKNDTYNLVCTNPNTTVREPILYDVKLVGVAPVIWHRKRFK